MRLPGSAFATIALAASAFAAGGCQSTNPPGPHPQQHAAINAATIEALNRSAVDEAIISQHTLYPYHFVRHSAELNELGRRDLHVLLAHYRAFAAPHGMPQPLNVRRGDTPSALYEARLATIVRNLADAGLSRDAIEIADGMPGGDGASTDRVITILAAEARAAAAVRGRQGLDSGGAGGRR
jgi:hypothetical protein